MNVQSHRELPVTLDQERKVELLEDFARAGQKHSKIKSEHDAVAAKAKAEMKHLTARMQEISATVLAGTEMRDVLCEERQIPEQNTVKVVRLDTDETVDERAMTPEDLQGELDLDGNSEEESDEVEFEIDEPIVAHTGDPEDPVNVFGSYTGTTEDGMIILREDDGTCANYSPNVVQSCKPDEPA